MRPILLICALVLLPTIETAKKRPQFPHKFKSQVKKVPWLRARSVQSPQIGRPIKNQVDRGVGVAYCLIPKAGSVITREILCDVLKEYKSIPYKPKTENVTADSSCDANLNYPLGWPKWMRPRDTLTFTVVRDPLERFISTYEFLCKYAKICAKRVKNIHQFANWLYHLHKIDLVGRRPRSKNLDDIVWHSWPQTNFCNIKSNKVLFVHHSRNRRRMEREMLLVFSKARIPSHVARKTLRHLYRSSTIHAVKNETHKKNLLKQVKKNPKTMRLLQAIYHEDFQFFKSHRFD